ncbi:MAG: sigma-54-dependent Fis family transcriptional regulator [Bacteroidetes bacterium HGW-Bacteroidetes-17]|jgi:DNA-binding NtrC family response regulator|nr:MAG: sigma-54-dependent Fis family transcriptional regulator [Bacteroidetes bacterium HGW-Bacteroidetes-17]
MSKTEASILIVDDDLDVLVSAQIFLKQLFTEVRVEQRPDKIPELMEIIDFDVILLDMNFTKGKNDGEEGIYWLNRILSINPAAVVIFITAYGGIDIAVQAMKVGCFDFLIKPWKNDKLLGSILAGLQLRKSKLEVEKLRFTNDTLDQEINQHFKEFVGNSLAIQKVFGLIEKVATTDADVLILGENGTGKELIAREIHKQSNRKNEAFIPVDLGAIHENLFESELFGHVKGAFTDAHTHKAGRFELAQKGTIFLDEIGNLSLPLQAKLLSVLQNRRVNRIGSGKEIPVDFRLICATNMPLYEMVQQGEFREDLLYRINVVEIKVPSLKERSGDIPLLVSFFMKKFTKKYNKPKLKLPQNVINLLSKYSWPGNIRELGHLIERAVILSDGIKLNFQDFASDFSNTKIQGNTEDNLNLEEMEKKHILKAISRNKGNITKAAKDLGIARTALYRRLEKYGL